MDSFRSFLHLLLILVISNAHLISCGPQFQAAAQTAWSGISDVLNWAKELKTFYERHQPNVPGRGWSIPVDVLGDCVKLYEVSEPKLARLASGNDYSSDDAASWLSGAMASNRWCLDGLDEKGLLFNTSLAHNLDFLLEKAFDSIEQGFGRSNHGTVISGGNGGLLGSWDARTSKADFVVAQDGSGQYKTINAALQAVAAMGVARPGRTIIYVKSGVYSEQVTVDRSLSNLMFVGDGMNYTIVTGGRSCREGATTMNSATFSVFADGFWARDMTFENTAGPLNQQAVALSVYSDLSIFYRCGMRGYQDTLLVWQFRQFFRECYIHGTIDYIFGDATAVFQNCDILVRKPVVGQANMIVAQGRLTANGPTGTVVMDSRVRPDDDFACCKHSFKSYLGRPWQMYSRTVFIRTDFDDLVDPEGWGVWKGDFALSTLFFAEYYNSGIGANTTNRVKWPGFHVLRYPNQAVGFSVRNFIQGDLWLPASGVPFSSDL